MWVRRKPYADRIKKLQKNNAKLKRKLDKLKPIIEEYDKKQKVRVDKEFEILESNFELGERFCLYGYNWVVYEICRGDRNCYVKCVLDESGQYTNSTAKFSLKKIKLLRRLIDDYEAGK